jgi:hypothetical protein
LPLDRFLNLVWHWASFGADDERRAKLLDALVEPVVTGNGQPHHAGLAPPNIPRPDWYKGDHAAFASSVRAASQLGQGR